MDMDKKDRTKQLQSIIDNYDTKTYREFAEEFGLKVITIAKRVERLKKRGLLPKGHKRIPGSADYSILKAKK